MNPTAYRVAARAILADQNKAAPKKVDDLFKEVKDGNPSYSDEQAWATAWSIYCKNVDPGSDHCHKSTGEYLKEAADLKPGDKVEVTQGKEKGLKGTVTHTKSGPHGNMVSVDLDHPVHKMLGPAILAPHALKKVGGAEGSISRPTPSADAKESMLGRLPPNHLNLFPSGKWGFVGSVDVRLSYLTPEGHELDLKKDAKFIESISQAGPGIVKAKSRVFATPYDAMEAAKKLGQGVTVAKHDMEKHPDIEEALKKSGVKHKIQ
jgi:hypothetical protein